MSRIDLVLLHAPSVYDFRERSIMSGPVSDMVPSTPAFEMYPLGFTTMAEYLERHGYKARIVNLAVLMLNRPGFDVEKAIREMDPVAFGIDLHWMPHAHGSVEIAKICKKYHPTTPVIFGGLTSSYFHEEIASYPWIDYVLRGDSTEEPLRRLMASIRGHGSPADVPNLTWKGPDGSVNVNELSWVPADMNDISLDYSFAMRGVIRYRDMMGSVPFKDWLTYPVCASLTCRGCTHDCATCGGSASAFRNHFGRDRVAFRDPELLVRDISHIQKYIPGPIFVLNDFLQAGPDYIEAFVKGLGRIGLRNPIGFEFFRPPKEDFYAFLDEHLPDYSVEISVESHDDAVRAAFGKSHYTTEQVEESIRAALRHGCKRFDLYFMTGIPTQSAASVLETGEYVRGLYERTGNDTRLLPFISPMAPFLDPGSKVFDDPDAYGYKLKAHTLEEHRQLLLEPSWRYIMNYESDAMTPAELVDSTYQAAIDINRVKVGVGVLTAKAAAMTEKRIGEARVAMARIEEIVAGEPGEREPRLAALRGEIEHLNESTVAEKSDLEWPRQIGAYHVINVIKLWFRENFHIVTRRQRFRPTHETPQPPAPKTPKEKTAWTMTDVPTAGGPDPGTPTTAPDPGTPTTEKVRGVFARIARRYDMMNSVISMGLHHRWRRRLVAEAALTPGCTVLDVASGTGDVAFAIARTGIPSRVVATDFVVEMLDIARVKAQGYAGPTALEFEIQDGQALTYPDTMFDVVTVSFGIRNMPDRAAGFREAHRVLKRGGRYLILEFSPPVSVWFRPLFKLYTGSIVPLLGGLIAHDRVSYQYLNDSIMQFPRPERLADELRAAGFSSVRWVPMLFGAVNLHVSVR